MRTLIPPPPRRAPRDLSPGRLMNQSDVFPAAPNQPSVEAVEAAGPGAVYKHRSAGQAGEGEAMAGSDLQSAWGVFLSVCAVTLSPAPPRLPSQCQGQASWWWQLLRNPSCEHMAA